MNPGDRFNPFKQFNGLWIPLWLVERREVSAGAKLLYSALARRAGENGECFPGQARLASDLGIGGNEESRERTVRRYLKELIENELLEVEQRGLQLTNVYHFVWHQWIDGQVRAAVKIESAPDRTNLSGQERTDLSGQDGTFLSGPIEEENKGEGEKEKQKKKTPPNQNRPADAGLPAAASGATASAPAPAGAGGIDVLEMSDEQQEHFAAACWAIRASGKTVSNEDGLRATLLKRWRSGGFSARDLQTLATWRRTNDPAGTDAAVSNADLIAAAGGNAPMMLGDAWRLLQTVKQQKKRAARGES